MSDSLAIVNGKPTIDKDPNATLDYVFDWSTWLAAHDPVDTITTHEVLVTGVTLNTSAIEGANRVRAWISGGTVGQPAQATCRITTAAGRVDDRTIFFKIKER